MKDQTRPLRSIVANFRLFSLGRALRNLCWGFIFSLSSAGILTALEIHVAPEGKVGAAGTLESPLPGLIEARDAIRVWRGAEARAEAVTVWVHGGVYEVREALILEPQDSGTAEFPVIYRAVEGGNPQFHGSLKITGFEPHEGKILKADLSSYELPEHPIRQLLFDGMRQPLARYPNIDPEDPLYSSWAFLDEFPEDAPEGDARKGFAYFKEGDLRSWSKPEELEINVFAAWGWWNYILPLATVDPETRKFTLAKDSGYDLRATNRYFIQNALEELDAPGEWYIDRKGQTLYFYPTAPISSAEVRIPVASQFIKLLPGTKHVTIRGLSFTGCIGTAVQFDKTEHCTIAGSTLTSVGEWGTSAIAISGENNLATGNEVSHTGNIGIALRGGDRKTLTSANNVADNNHIHHTGRIQKNGPGIDLRGVGNKVTHNHIHHIPRMAVQFTGNNLTIDYNHLHHTMLETQDGGAVYTGGRDWISSRGTTLRYNYIHDTIGCGQDENGTRHPHYAWGIYMDDNAGGLDIVGNIVVRSSRASIHLHNGRDHLIENNIFVDGGTGDQNGLYQIEYSGWTAEHRYFKSHLETMIAGWDEVKDHPAWKKLRHMDFDPRDALRPDGTIMSGNIARKNIVVWSDPKIQYAKMSQASPEYNVLEANLVWHEGQPLPIKAVHTGQVVGEDILHHDALMAATAIGARPNGWSWNHKPRPDLALVAEEGKVLRIEAATSEDPKHSKVGLRGPNLPMKIGVAYRTRMKIKASRPEMNVSFALAAYKGGEGYWQSRSQRFVVGTEWEEIEFDAALPDETTAKPWMDLFWMRTDINEDSGEVFLKEITMREVEVLYGWEAWQAQGWDRGSIVADPLFRDRKNDDYRLDPASPAFKLGFEAIPMEKIGQYPSELRADSKQPLEQP